MSKIQDKKDWYCIKFDVPKNKNMTALEFSRKMNDFLEQINEFNHSIVGGIDDTYTVASYIEDFEAGSVKWWLLDKLNKIDDKAIDKFVASPIKTTIAGILKISKKEAIEYLSKDSGSESPHEREMKIINPIIKEIESKESQLGRNVLSPRINIDKNRLLKSLSTMARISKELDENVFFIDDYNNQAKQIAISKNFEYSENLAAKSLEEEEGKVVAENIVDKILILLTPTAKENCMWEFEDESKIKCAIEDEQFFNDYKDGKIALHGREIMKVKLKTVQKLLEGNKIKNEYFALKLEITDNPAPTFFDKLHDK